MAACDINMKEIIMVYIICLSIWLNVSSMTWKLSNVSIPGLQNRDSAFIGYHNKTVHILGGYVYRNDSLEFPLDVAWNTSTITSIAFGFQHSQSSIQIDEQLWMLPQGEQYLSVYDLNKKSIIQTVLFPSGYSCTGHHCVISYNEYILLIGCLKHFHIYNRFTVTWSTGTSLKNERWAHSCNVIADTIYIICGYKLDTIEYLEMNANSCCNGIWIEMNDRLSSGKMYHRSVVFEKSIYVIGMNQIDIIDTIAKTISSPPTNKLVYGKRAVSAILVQNIIYVFGGYPYTDNIHYQYALIPTQNPTISSVSPSQYPTYQTIQPTNNPSMTPIPTSNPTFNPSISPSVNPTTLPSISPSNTPTVFPSVNPTMTPTYPLISPTHNPYPTHKPIFSSHNPTHNPTANPIKIPTLSPTNIPSTSPSGYPTTETTSPSNMLSLSPSKYPTYNPSITPTNTPSLTPTIVTINPSVTTIYPTDVPSISPYKNPTVKPTKTPSKSPSKFPTIQSIHPTTTPSHMPSISPTYTPTISPSKHIHSTISPTYTPTTISTNPTLSPSISQSQYPTNIPSISPSAHPTNEPTSSSSNMPSLSPSKYQTISHSETPTTIQPTALIAHNPTIEDIKQNTNNPTLQLPTTSPTEPPTTNVDQSEQSMYKITIAILIVILFIVICVMCFYMFKFKQNMDRNKHDGNTYDEDDVQITDVNPVETFIENEEKQQVVMLQETCETDVKVNNYSAIDNSTNKSDSEELYVQMLVNDQTLMEIEMVKSNILGKQNHINSGYESVKSWFTYKVNIPNYNHIYYQLFIDNGYDTLEIVQLLNEDKLRKINITKLGHIDKIMMEINNLKHKDQYNEIEGIGQSHYL